MLDLYQLFVREADVEYLELSEELEVGLQEMDVARFRGEFQLCGVLCYPKYEGFQQLKGVKI